MASYDDELEEGYDYSWHPSEEEFTSPITAEMWAELLGDPKFADTDAAKAVRCLKDYGEPATFQQLSIRYRSAMGRYRRWLAEAARTAGERFGVDAPTQDQFGLDEWWPVLYQTRNAGKPGAGIFEMQLRPEVIEAYEQLEEAEKMAKRKENALQLQRIEQLERARQEQRRREAERANAAEASRSIKPAAEDAAPQAKEPPKTSPKGAKKEAEQAPVVAPASPKPRQSETKADEAPHAPHISAPATKDEEPTGQVEKEKVAEALPATSAFLKLVGSGEGVAPVVSEAMPEMPETLDYKARYARRLREALSLIMEVEPHVTAATVARLIGDESVETLQDVLNGKAIPTFDCLDRLAGTLFIGTRRLEALDGLEGALPTFVSLAEVAGVEGASRLIADAPELKEIAFVTDDSRERRCAIIVRYATLRCCLLTRVAVSSARRRKTAPELPALTAARTELEEFCGRRSIALTEHEVGASDFDALVWGQIWPGWFFA